MSLRSSIGSAGAAAQVSGMRFARPAGDVLDQPVQPLVVADLGQAELLDDGGHLVAGLPESFRLQIQQCLVRVAEHGPSITAGSDRTATNQAQLGLYSQPGTG